MVTVFPLLFYLEDQIVDSVQDVRKQIDDIWLTIQDYRVNFLIFFMFIVGSTPNAGSAFTNFLLGPLKFTDEQYMYIDQLVHEQYVPILDTYGSVAMNQNLDVVPL